MCFYTETGGPRENAGAPSVVRGSSAVNPDPTPPGPPGGAPRVSHGRNLKEKLIPFHISTHSCPRFLSPKEGKCSTSFHEGQRVLTASLVCGASSTHNLHARSMKPSRGEHTRGPWAGDSGGPSLTALCLRPARPEAPGPTPQHTCSSTSVSGGCVSLSATGDPPKGRRAPTQEPQGPSPRRTPKLRGGCTPRGQCRPTAPPSAAPGNLL